MHGVRRLPAELGALRPDTAHECKVIFAPKDEFVPGCTRTSPYGRRGGLRAQCCKASCAAALPAEFVYVREELVLKGARV